MPCARFTTPNSAEFIAYSAMGSQPSTKLPFPFFMKPIAAHLSQLAYHVREIEALGLDVTLTRPAPEPGPDEPGSTQAA